MYLVVGLGNPGQEYEGSRHNVGFAVADAARDAASLPGYRSKHGALVTSGKVVGRDVVLAKPQTYMNLSGESVQPLASYFKIAPGEIVVIHDELDLPFGDVRRKVGGGHAGHNGVRNIIDRLGTPAFVRVRVGVGRPARASPADQRTARDHVLSAFEPHEAAALPGVLDRALKELFSALGAS